MRFPEFRAGAHARHTRGSRLHAGSELLGINPRQVFAWVFNVALLLVGMGWLVILLHGLQQGDDEQEQQLQASAADAADTRAAVAGALGFSLLQSPLLIDAVKVCACDGPRTCRWPAHCGLCT